MSNIQVNHSTLKVAKETPVHGWKIALVPPQKQEGTFPLYPLCIYTTCIVFSIFPPQLDRNIMLFLPFAYSSVYKS